jgi:hypothetical protein
MIESETHQTVINLSSFMSWVAEQGDRQAVLREQMVCDRMEESGTEERRPSQQVGLTGVGLKLPMTVSDPIVMS